MKTKAFVICLFTILSTTLVAATSLAETKLIAIGGGKRPAKAMELFVDWAGGSNAKILVITWATQEPEASYKALSDDFAAHNPLSISHAEQNPKLKRQTFIQQLNEATGVFFSGGDQNLIMDILDGDPLLHEEVKNKYFAGTVFGGTSAGTAVLPTLMMTGDHDPSVIEGKTVQTRQGLGLTPDLILDQHYIVRQRHNRLFGLILANQSKVGVGIDEGMALAISDNSLVKVIGPTQVLRVRAKKSRLTIDIYKDGQIFKL